MLDIINVLLSSELVRKKPKIHFCWFLKSNMALGVFAVNYVILRTKLNI